MNSREILQWIQDHVSSIRQLVPDVDDQFVIEYIDDTGHTHEAAGPSLEAIVRQLTGKPLPTRDQLVRILDTWKKNGKCGDYRIDYDGDMLYVTIKSMPNTELRGQKYDFKKGKWVTNDGPFKNISQGDWYPIHPHAVMSQGEYRPK